MDRANNIPSTEEEVSRETKRVAEALAANNHPANFIHNGRQLNRQQEMNDTDHRGMVILPYARGFSERVATFSEVSTSRSPINLFAPSRAYLKSQKTRSKKRLPEES